MLYEKLTAYDIDMFSSYVQTYGGNYDAEIYGQMANPKHILRFWDSAKSQYLHSLFGEKFILEKQIEFTTPIYKIKNEISQSLEYGEMSSFKTTFKAAILEVFGNFCDEYYFLMRLFDKTNLADNIAHTLPNTSITFPTGETIKLTNTAKTIKLMGKVSKILKIEKEFEAFRLKHSLFLNQKKVKGTLCLSIHPMDYLTMSDNENGWTSCMSWRDDGDYRMGTVEMMNSPNVIVAYLKSNDKKFTFEKEYSWNSKLWRTLIVVDPTIITSVKNYPYENLDAINQCIEWLRELATQNLQWSFPHPIERIFERDTFEYNKEPRYLICNTNKMYNDFGCCDHYGILSDSFGEQQEITYSGETECMWCGEIYNSTFYSEASFVFCSNCSDGGSQQISCDQCGNYCDEDEIYWVEDVPLCPDCCANYAICCDICQEYIFTDHSKEIFLARIDDNPNKDYDYLINVSNEYAILDYHYEKSSWLLRYFKTKPHYNEEKDIYYWNIEDLSEEGLWQYFGLRTAKKVQDYRDEALGL